MKLLDVSYRYGYPCTGFLPEMEQLVVSSFGAIPQAVGHADVVAFGGGADIATGLYNHKAVYPGVCEIPSDRDLFEVAVFREALRQRKPLLGICRGSQFLCAMAGGALIQDVSGHTSSHGLITYDNMKGLTITSTHHQMMDLTGVKRGGDYDLLAWTDRKGKNYQRDKKKSPMEQEVDPEVVYFKKYNALCIQGHPEYMAQEEPVVKWLKSKFYSLFPELKQ